MKLDDAAAHLEALGNPTRLKIYRALVRAGRRGLAGRPPAGQAEDRAIHPVPSHQDVGGGRVSITQVREATTLICHANYDVMRGLVDFLVAECCADAPNARTHKTAA